MPEGKNKIEVFKEQSHSLRGTIATALQQETTRFAEADSHVLKRNGRCVLLLEGVLRLPAGRESMS